MHQYLFSYGTLQLEKVQIASFGRILTGSTDKLYGYKLVSIEITDENVLQQSGQKFHPMALPASSDDYIDGVVFEITHTELLQADHYEVDDYKRISVLLNSGIHAWIYIKA
ncbi:MAG: gamma-glutamylcyclotransferase [Sphingobacteriia bacterium]|jgi:hypothetical protein|nr:MAG: gamma-glutamylcyclotransferase [Sphingobacteriia bacterium]TAG29482.1 MAG: gamma-glutamylcyclotransferase [Sphingobacteriia bacterium]